MLNNYFSHNFNQTYILIETIITKNDFSKLIFFHTTITKTTVIPNTVCVCNKCVIGFFIKNTIHKSHLTEIKNTYMLLYIDSTKYKLTTPRLTQSPSVSDRNTSMIIKTETVSLFQVITNRYHHVHVQLDY